MVLGKEYSGSLRTNLFLSLRAPSAVNLTRRLTSCGYKTAFSSSWGVFLHIQQKQETLCFSISGQRLYLHPDWLLREHGYRQANHCAWGYGVHSLAKPYCVFNLRSWEGESTSLEPRASPKGAAGMDAWRQSKAYYIHSLLGVEYICQQFY